MPSLMNIFNVAGSAMSAQAQRLNVTASNLANADSTTGPDGQPYKAKQVVFAVDPLGGARTASGQQVGGVQVTGVIDDPTPMKTSYDPTNPAANPDGYVTLAERRSGAGNGQHDFRVAFVSGERRDAQHRQAADAQDPDDRNLTPGLPQ